MTLCAAGQYQGVRRNKSRFPPAEGWLAQLIRFLLNWLLFAVMGLIWGPFLNIGITTLPLQSKIVADALSP